MFKKNIIIQVSIKEACNLFFNNLFPSLFPILIISYILVNLNLLSYINNFFYKLNKHLFNINKNTSLIFIISILTGSPGNSKCCKELYENKLINRNDIQKILLFSHFSNPLFILSMVENRQLLVLVAHYISNIFIGIIYKNKYISECTYNIKDDTNKKTFFNVFFDSINSATTTLLFILGTIVTFYIVTSIINIPILKLLLELCQGMKYIQLLNIGIKYKTLLYGFILSFGGFCIHFQVFGILDNIKIKYLPYLKSRILHGIITVIIIYIFY